MGLLMNFLRDQVPTIEDALSLEVHELAFLVLGQMQAAEPKPKHAANWLIELAGAYDPPLHTRQPQPRRREEFSWVIAEAIQWLTARGLVATLYESNYTYLIVTRRGRGIDTEDAFRLYLRETAFSPELLHSVIRKEAWPLYARGKFDSAVFEAFKRVEIAVRAAGGFGPTQLGPELMRRAFHADKGTLSDSSLPAAERESIMHLFAGAMGAFKNPGSHREVGLDDPSRAAELLMFASHLLRIVDDRVSR
jgi:uncharacterized protein (TIGR02391 family)